MLNSQAWLFAVGRSRLREAGFRLKTHLRGLMDGMGNHSWRQVFGRAAVGRLKVWCPEVREAAEIVYRASVVCSTCSISQQAGCLMGILRIVGEWHQRSLSAVA